jgi:hypothetical protein
MNVLECCYFNGEQLCHGCLFTALSRVKGNKSKLSTFIIAVVDITRISEMSLKMKIISKKCTNTRSCSEWPVERCVSFML